MPWFPDSSSATAVTRTLTVLYSTTLLSIFTHVQLSLLGRYKYVQSIIQLEQDEQEREELEFSTSFASMFSSFPASNEDVEALVSGGGQWPESDIWRDGVNEETERRFLTLSWWILNVGWRDVGERVRRGVEEVFEGFVCNYFFPHGLWTLTRPTSVSLKSKLGAVELHRLVCDVRRRVEYEVTFEGTERRIKQGVSSDPHVM